MRINKKKQKLNLWILPTHLNILKEHVRNFTLIINLRVRTQRKIYLLYIILYKDYSWQDSDKKKKMVAKDYMYI